MNKQNSEKHNTVEVEIPEGIRKAWQTLLSEIKERCLNRNFGTLSKSEFDLMLFHYYLGNKQEEVGSRYVSDYDIGRDLGLTIQRVRSLRERDALKQVVSLLRVQDSVPCTACRYCTEVCPQGIAIPEIFAALNAKRTSGTPTPAGLLPYQCIRCGECENSCPQNLPIRDLLETAVKELG